MKTGENCILVHTEFVRELSPGGWDDVQTYHSYKVAALMKKE